MKPRVFIASSAESLDIAHMVQQELDRDAEATVWTQDVFKLSQTSAESLIQILGQVDFGVFVFAPADVLRIRGDTQDAVRDNVIYELGLFTGRLGRERCFMLKPKFYHVTRLPSDLAGLTAAEYDPGRQDGNLRAAIGPACHEIRTALRRLGRHAAFEQTQQGNAPSYRFSPAFRSKDIAGLWVSRFDYRAFRAGVFVSGRQYDIEVLVASGERSFEGHNVCSSTAIATENAYWHDLQGQVRGSYVLGNWFNRNSVNLGGFQLYVHTHKRVMVGSHTGNANDNSVQCGDWVWLRVSSERNAHDRLLETMQEREMLPATEIDDLFESCYRSATAIEIDQVLKRR